ncbi:DNA polymerase ligase N-terminal domain-containing protein [Thermopolyspora sp. NPDC052614]|uniref:DNA polymerase ligase N-terminal domain-containing protein n=1 Tax=Thermopolyspora sp. NPDC052614 TaxID=3155682 RepID=UPI003421B235
MAGDKLDPYRGKRDRKRTPEPIPENAPLPQGNDDTFVIQEHHARRLHWDLRLERDGVLVSWAVPKGLPRDPSTNHLAVHTEDHPLEYAAFEGEIPKGEYGGGRVLIWDRGTYETEKWTEREVKVVLHGSQVSGRYVLFQTDGKNWMVHRMDPPLDPAEEPLPRVLLPMLASRRSRLPSAADGYTFEFAWGGERTLAYVEGGRVRFTDATGADVTGDHPRARALGAQLGARPALLDGEMTDLEGTPTYVIFDVLHLDGRPLLAEPHHRRRAVLDRLGLSGAHWQNAPSFPGEGAAVRRVARDRGLPGVIAKRRDSPYVPGTTSDAWLLIPT